MLRNTAKMKWRMQKLSSKLFCAKWDYSGPMMIIFGLFGESELAVYGRAKLMKDCGLLRTTISRERGVISREVIKFFPFQ